MSTAMVRPEIKRERGMVQGALTLLALSGIGAAYDSFNRLDELSLSKPVASKAEVDRLVSARDRVHAEQALGFAATIAAAAGLAGYRFGSRREPEAITENVGS